MAKTPIISIMGQDLDDPKKEAQYYKWYHDGHIPAFFNFKGMKRVYRYKRIGDDANIPQYLTVYHFDSLEARKEYEKSPEREAGLKVQGRPEGVKVRMNGLYELIKGWEK